MQNFAISSADYTKILQDIYKTKEVCFLRGEFKPISKNVEGFLGEHHNLQITFKLRDITTTEVFFIKIKPQSNKLQIEVSNQLSAYKKEIFLYDCLLKEFQKYGIDVSFAPKCLFVVPGEALIFENLSLKDFVLSDRHEPFNMAQIKCALKALAKFHGAGINYDLKKTTEMKHNYSMADDFADIFQESLFIMATDPNGYAMKFWRGTFKMIRLMIDLLPGDETFKEKFISMVFGFKYGEVFAQPTKYLKTCGHGDLWSNNMMFKYEGDESIECRLLDFQTCRYFYPAFDVVLLVFGNTTPCFREKNLQKIFKYYYGCLEDVLAKQGYQLNDIMPYSDFLETVKLVQRDTMLQIIMCVAAVNLPKELLNSFLEAGNIEKLEKFMFDNGEICAEAFRTDEKYRNIISEAFQEYFNILLSYE